MVADQDGKSMKEKKVNGIHKWYINPKSLYK